MKEVSKEEFDAFIAKFEKLYKEVVTWSTPTRYNYYVAKSQDTRKIVENFELVGYSYEAYMSDPEKFYILEKTS